VSSGSTETFEDGDMLHFIMEPGQLALALSEGDGDLVKQSVSSDMNQAAQHVLLNSSFNSVNNVLGITVGLSELQQFDRLQVQNAISAMKGNGF